MNYSLKPRTPGGPYWLTLTVPSDLRTLWKPGKFSKQIREPTGKKELAEAMVVALPLLADIYARFVYLRQPEKSGIQKLIENLVENVGGPDAFLNLAPQLKPETPGEYETRLLNSTPLRPEDKILSDEFDSPAGKSADYRARHETRKQLITALVEPTKELTLKPIIDSFLAEYDKSKQTMFKAHNQVLPLFLAVIGDVPVTTIKQADIKSFFNLVNRLTPGWAKICKVPATNRTDYHKQLKIAVEELVARDLEPKLSPKTFEDTFVAAVRPFLRFASRDYGDQGFPLGLTTDGIKYTGGRKAGENKQRAFTSDEILKLLQALKPIAASPTQSARAWLPLLGLFTGARINELCQINPMIDVGCTSGGIHFLSINGEEDEEQRETAGIKKLVKTTTSVRLIPVHPYLMEIGFLEYVNELKKAGKYCLFPVFPPTNTRASPAAVKWFSGFLTKAGLKDNAFGNKLSGSHAFRFTIIRLADDSGGLNVERITGHKKSDLSEISAGYLRDSSVQRKLTILKQISYPFGINDLPRPVRPTVLDPPSARATTNKIKIALLKRPVLPFPAKKPRSGKPDTTE